MQENEQKTQKLARANGGGGDTPKAWQSYWGK